MSFLLFEHRFIPQVTIWFQQVEKKLKVRVRILTTEKSHRQHGLDLENFSEKTEKNSKSRPYIDYRVSP